MLKVVSLMIIVKVSTVSIFWCGLMNFDSEGCEIMMKLCVMLLCFLKFWLMVSISMLFILSVVFLMLLGRWCVFCCMVIIVVLNWEWKFIVCMVWCVMCDCVVMMILIRLLIGRFWCWLYIVRLLKCVSMLSCVMLLVKMRMLLVVMILLGFIVVIRCFLCRIFDRNRCCRLCRLLFCML